MTAALNGVSGNYVKNGQHDQEYIVQCNVFRHRKGHLQAEILVIIIKRVHNRFFIKHGCQFYKSCLYVAVQYSKKLYVAVQYS